MKIIHGTWIPSQENNFIQNGTFYLWVEIAKNNRSSTKTNNLYPCQLTPKDLADFITQELGISGNNYHDPVKLITTKYFFLPSHNHQPLPSLTLSRYLEFEYPEISELQSWSIDCFPLPEIIKNINNIHFLSLDQAQEWVLGIDLLFWYYYTQNFKSVILKDQYIPSLKYRQIKTNQKSSKSRFSSVEIYPGWAIVSHHYQQLINQSIEMMPLACVAGFTELPESINFYDKETLLHHFSEYLLQQIIKNTSLPKVFTKKIDHSPLLYNCIFSARKPWTDKTSVETYQQWQTWHQKIITGSNNSEFNLCFRLKEASEENPEQWYLEFLVTSKKDLSLKLNLDDYWNFDKQTKQLFPTQFGQEFEQNLLLNLGYAARIYPKLWAGLETDKPVGVPLSLTEAFDFLKEQAWILQDAGYTVIVPGWWTPIGRQKAKIRLQASAKKSSSSSSKNEKGYFSLDSIIQYQYQLAIGNEIVTPQEWQQLLEAKVPLVKFRGQWVELDQNQMQKMLEFWQNNNQENPEMSLLELMKTATEEVDMFEVSHDDSLAQMMAQLTDYNQLELTDNPDNFQGNLREYQKRGVSWLKFLEQLGLNGCLADDMGLGKTVQVIAHLVKEKNDNQQLLPTLLIAPTSVVGNRYKEVEKFAPHLKVMIHHGGNRNC